LDPRYLAEVVVVVELSSRRESQRAAEATV
jgi:hypothetical protein